MRGGYRIADFKKTALTSGTQASIKNLYAAVSNPYKKAVLVSGLVVGDVAYPDFSAVFVKVSDNYVAGVVINGSQVNITVTPTDNVTVTVASAAGTQSTAETRSVKVSKSKQV